MSDTRVDFFRWLEGKAEDDKDIILLVGDLGYSFVENFQKRFPEQFINCGIAEQNMVGVAAGLARVGKKPFIYSGAVFLLTRALEQLRDDVFIPQLHNVTVVCTGASEFLGSTHNFEKKESISHYISPFKVDYIDSVLLYSEMNFLDRKFPRVIGL